MMKASKFCIQTSVSKFDIPCFPNCIDQMENLGNAILVLSRGRVLEFVLYSDSIKRMTLLYRAYLRSEDSVRTCMTSVGCKVVTGHADGSLLVWVCGKPGPQFQVASCGAGEVISMSGNRSLLAVSCQTGQIFTGALSSKGVVFTRRTHVLGIVQRCVAWLPDGEQFATGGADGIVRLYRKSTRRPSLWILEQHVRIPRWDNSSQVTSIACLDDWIISGDSRGQVTFWSKRSMSRDSQAFKSHGSAVIAVKIQLSTVITIGLDGCVCRFIRDEGHWRKELLVQEPLPDPSCVILMGDSHLLAGGRCGAVVSLGLCESKCHVVHSGLPEVADVQNRSTVSHGTNSIISFDHQGVQNILSVSSSVLAHACNGHFLVVSGMDGVRVYALNASGMSRRAYNAELRLLHVRAVCDNSFAGLSTEQEVWRLDVYSSRVCCTLVSKLQTRRFVTCFDADEDSFGYGAAYPSIVRCHDKVHLLKSVPTMLLRDGCSTLVLTENRTLLWFRKGRNELMSRCPHPSFDSFRSLVRTATHNVYVLISERACYSIQVLEGEIEWTLQRSFTHQVMYGLLDDCNQLVVFQQTELKSI
jgi:WD40 repeat protein